jgi:hypothetical protein
MYPENETMQKGQPRRAVKKSYDGRMSVEALLVGPPGCSVRRGTSSTLAA